MIPFRYGGFWDVPRFIQLKYRDRSLLLLCIFDDASDDYPDRYTVWEVPADVEVGSELKWWWEDSQGREDFVAIGTVAVKDVRFDSLPRPEMLDPSVLDEVVRTEHSGERDKWCGSMEKGN